MLHRVFFLRTMVEPTEGALAHSPFLHPGHRGEERYVRYLHVWHHLGKEKRKQENSDFSPICCMNKLLCDTNENFHEIAAKEICYKFMKKSLVSPKH